MSTTQFFKIRNVMVGFDFKNADFTIRDWNRLNLNTLSSFIDFKYQTQSRLNGRDKIFGIVGEPVQNQVIFAIHLNDLERELVELKDSLKEKGAEVFVQFELLNVDDSNEKISYVVSSSDDELKKEVWKLDYSKNV